jgi:UDP-2,3-diacylglucosamine pyrophosphatase LpxH
MSEKNLLVIGDLHFRLDNVEESQHFVLTVERYLNSQSIAPFDAIVLLGDILHSFEKVYTFAMNIAVQFIQTCSKFAPVYCLVGNHDATSNTIFCSDNHWMNVLKGMPNVIVVDKPVLVFPGIVACPYVCDGKFVKALNTLQNSDWRFMTLIFAHQLINGAKMGGIVATEIEDWSEQYPQVISGHVHEPQKLFNSRWTYIGNANETGNKGIVQVQVNTETHEVLIANVSLVLKERKIVHTSVKDLLFLKLQPNETYKIVVEDDAEAIKAFKKTAKAKELEKHPAVKRVQYKTLENNRASDNTDDEEKQPADFLQLLLQKVQEDGDPYLTSYSNSLIANTPDMSDKDVQLE